MYSMTLGTLVLKIKCHTLLVMHSLSCQDNIRPSVIEAINAHNTTPYKATSMNYIIPQFSV